MTRLIDAQRALGHSFEPRPTSWTERDLALYALATGAADDPSDERALRRAYEAHPAGLTPLPGFFSVLALGALLDGLRRGEKTPGLDYGLERVMHAEQTSTIDGPLPLRGTLTHRARISGIFDKGRHAIVVTTVESSDAASGLTLKNDIASLVRSAGGFGGERGEERVDRAPDRAPDAVVEQKTRSDQALMFRMLGDDNPLHADPRVARTFGLKAPILHGMCTLAFAERHVIDSFAGGDGALVRGVRVRFSDVVFPGETLLTEAWKLGEGDVVFRARVKERDRVVLSHGEIRFGSAQPREAVTPAGDIEPMLARVSAYLAERPALARAVQAVFQFRLRDPERAFFIDLTGPRGVLSPGIAPRADCTLELSSRDFVALNRGEIRGKALYLTGALKMTGRTELAPHLDFLREANAAPKPSPESVAPAAAQAAHAFGDAIKLARVLPTEPIAIAIRVSELGDFSVVLGPGPDFRAGAPPAPRVTLRMNASSLAALAARTSTLRALYMHGAVRVDGDFVAARALDAALTGAEEKS